MVQTNLKINLILYYAKCLLVIIDNKLVIHVNPLILLIMVQTIFLL